MSDSVQGLDSGELPTYNELADVMNCLPLLMRENRRRRRLSLRFAAKEMDIGYTTVARMESGADCTLSNAVAALRWLELGGA